MSTRSIQLGLINQIGLILLILFLVLLAAACSPQAEPAAPAPQVIKETVVVVVTTAPQVIRETVVVVVTATDVPPTPTQEIIYVVVTSTREPGAAGTGQAVIVEATAVSEETPEAVTDTAVEATAEAGTAPGPPSAEEAEVRMSLNARKSRTQYSLPPEPFTVPASLADILPPDNWTDLQTASTIVLKSYAGMRVVEGGEAYLDLGDLTRLVLKNNSVIQTAPGSLVQEALNGINVDFEGKPPLQQSDLTTHLFGGGVLGEKTVGSRPSPLTTPNAIVLINRASFFLIYDPVERVTYVGNFDGTIDVADVASKEGEALPGGQMITIPAIRGSKYWPLHPHMTTEEFSRLIDLMGSPLAAVKMISGPYLHVKFYPELALRNGPGAEYVYAGTIKQGEYARIIGRGRGWWQIECPKNASAATCWVSGNSIDVGAYNVDISPVPDTTP